MNDIFVDVHEVVDEMDKDPARLKTRMKCSIGVRDLGPFNSYHDPDSTPDSVARTLEHQAMFLEETAVWNPDRSKIIDLYTTAANKIRNGME